MPKALLQTLVDDADLVADVGVRLGRIKSVEFLTALSKARHALNTDAAVFPEVIAELQKWLNSVVNDISPITLNDLRAGWRPFDTHTEKRFGTLIFGFFCFLLLVSTAYMTQVYNRASLVYAMTLELQETRGAEQAIRLFGLLIKNQKDVVESLTTGNKDFLYEVFNKALFDLQLMHIKFQAYKPSADRVIKDLNLYARFKDLVLHPDAWLAGEDGAILNNDLGIIEGEKNSNQQALPLPVVETSQAASVAAPDPTKPDILAALQTYFTEIKKFTSSIRVDFDPLVPTDYSFYLTPLREGMSTLGLWILPSLYGMLGAVIFHMRRLLEPNVPNPSWLRFAYRIVLGGFAGIILVWFWNPSPQKLTQPAFSTLTSFGLAFVVGFSTDVFFQALDRLVHYLSQAVGKEGT